MRNAILGNDLKKNCACWKFCHLKFTVRCERAQAMILGEGNKNFLRQKPVHDLNKMSHSTYFGCTSITVSLDGVLPLIEMSFDAGKRKSSNRSLISFSPASWNSRHSLKMVTSECNSPVQFHSPKPFLSTPSQVKRVLINLKWPASKGNSFSVK